MKDALDLIFEVIKLVKYSPKRDVQFEKLKVSYPRVPCAPRDGQLGQHLLNLFLTITLCCRSYGIYLKIKPSMKAHIIGVEAQFKTTGHILGYNLDICCSDNLSKTLQSDTLYAAAGQRIAAMTVNTLQSIRNDECFDMFWQKIERARQPLNMEAPRLPRKRKAPKRYDDGRAEPEFCEDPKPFYRKQ